VTGSAAALLGRWRAGLVVTVQGLCQACRRYWESQSWGGGRLE